MVANLRQEQRRVLAQLFRTNQREELEAKAEELRVHAFDEWLDWISGSRRPTSLTEQTIERILAIYSNLIDEVPKVQDLVRRFNLPVGRARYIVSTLKYTSNPDFVAKLLRKLDYKLEEAESRLGEREETEVILTQPLWDQVELIVGELLESGAPVNWPKTLGRNPYTREYQLTKSTIQEIRSRLREMLR